MASGTIKAMSGHSIMATKTGAARQTSTSEVLSPRHPPADAFPPRSCGWWLLAFLSALLGAATAAAQTNLAPGSYVRSYVNDLPDQPLITVMVTGLDNVSCFTVE